MSTSATAPDMNHAAYWRTSPDCQLRMLSPPSFAPHAVKSMKPLMTFSSIYCTGRETKRKSILWVTNIYTSSI